jgi:hypothetical protein
MDDRVPARDEVAPTTEEAPSDATPIWQLAVMALPAVAVLGLAVLTPVASLFPNQGDVDLYRRIAAQVLGGARPYADVSLPYPPLALVPMLVPAVVWLPGNPDLSAYKALFGAWEAGLLLVLAWVVQRLAAASAAPDERARARDSAIRLTVLALLAIFPVTFRFDLFPTLLAAAAVLAAIEDRPIGAGVAVALGTLAKLFPIALVPALGIRWVVGRRRDLATFGLGLAIAGLLGLAPFVLNSGTAASQVLGYQSDRGLELESLGSSLALAVAALGGAPARVYSAFSSMNVDGSVAQSWLDLDRWLTVAAFAGVAALMAWRIWLAHVDRVAIAGETVLRLAALTLVALLLVNKVFSVQYVVWLLPFGALLPWRPFAVVAVVVGLSTAIHPYLFDRLIRQDTLAVGVLVARNALLVGLAAWLVKGLARPAGLEPTTFRSAT